MASVGLRKFTYKIAFSGHYGIMFPGPWGKVRAPDITLPRALIVTWEILQLCGKTMAAPRLLVASVGARKSYPYRARPRATAAAAPLPRGTSVSVAECTPHLARY